MSYIYNRELKPATKATIEANKKVKESISPEYFNEEDKDIEEFRKHLLYELDDEVYYDENGKIIYDRKIYNQFKSDTPDTVNPLLWKNAQNGIVGGVTELVKDKVYAILNLATAPIGFIRGESGWIVQDSGGNIGEAEVSLNLIEKTLNENIRNNVKALIISHTHCDHFGGATVFRKYSPDVKIYGPDNYEQSLINDNLYGGVAMSRRVQYQCGLFIPRNEKSAVSIGVSTVSGVKGQVTTVLPDVYINENTSIAIDGIEVEFTLTPNTETEAHLVSYFKPYNFLFVGDNIVGTLHNTYTMRGAPVRDANYWGLILYKLYLDYGDDVQVILTGHGIPHWKSDERKDKLKAFLLDNAAAYKYTSDEALLLANKGYNLNEIAHNVRIPDSISKKWYTRGHYGNYSFNARGAYQKYLGFYDGNPVHLLPLPEKKLAEKFIEYVGSTEKVLEKAEQDFEKGEYQWVATVTNHLVFDNPENSKARLLCADALEQLAYQTENALWRNSYVSAATELRNPEFHKLLNISAMNNSETIPFVDADKLLDHLGINFDGYLAEQESYNSVDTLKEYVNGKLQFILNVVDDVAIKESHIINIYKGTVFHWQINPDEYSNIPVINATHKGIYQLATGHYQESKSEFTTEYENILNWIDKYVTDTQKYKNFNLIEPLDKD